MERHFDDELEALQQTLLAMGGLVEDEIHRACRALVERDEALAQEVIDREEEMELLCVEVDERCVELLALHQPTAADLRFIITSMKIDTDLERIGDQAVNIAQRARSLIHEPQLKPSSTCRAWPSWPRRWCGRAWTPSCARDTELARAVFAGDDEVDSLREQVFRELLAYMMADPATIPRALRLILISRNLERIADHATNIAEDVIYIVRGEDVRERGDKELRKGLRVAAGKTAVPPRV